jgi:lysophospholipase L1-like esterase
VDTPFDSTLKMHSTLTKLSNVRHVTIVACGDSINAETFHTRGRMNWVSLLREAIFERYGSGVCTLIKSGRCGSTCEDALTRVDRDGLRFDPDLTTLSFGMNDAFPAAPPTSGSSAPLPESASRACAIRATAKSSSAHRTP